MRDRVLASGAEARYALKNGHSSFDELSRQVTS